MSPRQLLRLRETRSSSTYDDQKTPSQILLAESEASTVEEFADYIISQLRQITGESDWKDPPVASLVNLALRDSDLVNATCQNTDAVGDFVYASGGMFGGLYDVTKADVTDPAKMPAWGVIQSKSAPAECVVRYRGILAGVYSGLTIGRVYFVGLDGRPTLDLASIPSRGFRQPAGTAIAADAILLESSASMVRVA